MFFYEKMLHDAFLGRKQAVGYLLSYNHVNALQDTKEKWDVSSAME